MKTISLCLALSFFTHLCPALTLTLSAVPERVAAHNPSLAAARLGIDEARGRLLSAGRRANPEAGFELNHDSRFREGMIGLSLDQKFPLTARLRLEKTLSAHLVAAAELEVRDMERKLVAEARSLVVKVLALQEHTALGQKQTELAAKLVGFIKGRADAGELSFLDAAQADLNAQRLALEGRKHDIERLTLIGELRPLLGLGAQEQIIVTGALPAIVDDAGARDWKSRADYQLALLKETASETGVNLARSRKWDDLTAGLVVEGENHEDGVEGLTRNAFWASASLFHSRFGTRTRAKSPRRPPVSSVRGWRRRRSARRSQTRPRPRSMT